MFGLFGSDSEDEQKKDKQKQRKLLRENKQDDAELKIQVNKKCQKERRQKNKKSITPENKKEAVSVNYLIKSSVFGEKEKEYKLQSLVNKIYKEEQSHKLTIEFFEKEDDEGTVEYKQQLLDISKERLQQLMSQMKYRSLEGQGTCTYKIGLEDNGKPLGLNESDMLESSSNICEMASQLGLEAVLQRVCQGHTGLIWELIIRRKQQECLQKSMKVVLMGPPQAGKSSLLGTLLSGQLDDGQGASRMHVLNHKHEVLSGETSSMSMHLLGYDSQGQIINNKQPLFGVHAYSPAEIQDNSSKVIQVIDIGGKHKYNTLLIQTLMTQSPQYVLLVLKETLDKSTMDQIALVVKLKIQLIIVLSHQDLKTSNEDTLVVILQQLQSVCSSATLVSCNNLSSPGIVPVFQVSSKTGYGISLLQTYFSRLSPDLPSSPKAKCEFIITNKFIVNNMIVLGGTLLQGCLYKYQKVLLGPNHQGLFQSVEIQNIEVNKVPVLSASNRQSCAVIIQPGKALALELELGHSDEEAIRKGMVLTEDSHPKAVKEFVVELTMYQADEGHQRVCFPYSYQPVVHFNSGRKSCIIKKNVKPIKKQMSKSNGHRSTKDKEKGQSASDNSFEMSNNLRYIKTLFYPEERVIQRRKTSMKRKSEDPEDFFWLSQQSSSANQLRMVFQYSSEYIKIGQQLVISDDNLKAIGTVIEIIR